MTERGVSPLKLSSKSSPQACKKMYVWISKKMMLRTYMVYNLEVAQETIERKRSWLKDLMVKLQLLLARDVV